YKVLGVSRSATHEEMKKAHRKLCMMYHPDKAKDRNRDEATKMMAEINRAWDVLGDEEARKVYDESGVIQGVDL
ncbi:heat shock protein DnaJ domain protein, partial [Amniculicola lignicola CBS 123094]